MRVLLIFIDGFGLGGSDPEINPLARYRMAFLEKLFPGGLGSSTAGYFTEHACLIATDAKLGVSGLPQSATGQTALFTGVNAPRIIGRHVQAFPGPQLSQIIYSHGIMRQLSLQGFSVTSANMYMPNYIELVAQRKRRHSATTLVIFGAGQGLRSVPEMKDGLAVYQDITNETLSLFGVHDVPVVTPAEAGKRLLRIASCHHFTMFEYFQTDRCGHKQNWCFAHKIISILDEFLYTIYSDRPDDLLVIITSDHGNFEDFSVKTHTLNPVPTIVFGCKAGEAAGRIRDLTDITPTIIKLIGKE